ncbi:NAD-dependent epimerase/dehydratase family protein [Humibacillus xanthopallidus]|uniref:NAD-dependent epimerase/dehydratase family protein n=2 Tax=Humibacillus xanthopallidus TaxID=412689 RepID=A0A543PKA3_9MICO|nr:NAD-dependent epimerase/dehydratase family protein [Humibacillus xanthopallidus]
MTGAAGRIATAIRPLLIEAGHSLVLCDAAEMPGVPATLGAPATAGAPGTAGGPGERVVSADLRDVDAHVAAFTGADLVVHLGALADERPWPELLAVNVDGTRAVCEAARLAGVDRLLLASSVHAVGYLPADSTGARRGMPLPAPDTYYGVSKAAVEALGGLFARRFAMTVVSARIMAFSAAPVGTYGLHWWLSPADMVRLVLATLTTGADGHHVVWGVSRNTRSQVDLTPGLAIGFDPQDDAEVHACRIERLGPAVSPRVLGGVFADDDYQLGERHGGRAAPHGVSAAPHGGWSAPQDGGAASR